MNITARINTPNARHLYQLTVVRIGQEWTQENRKTIEVEANTSTQATAIAKRNGYYAGDCNMVG